MAEAGAGRFFLTPAGRGEGYRKLPSLLTGRRRWRFIRLLAIGVMQSVVAVTLAICIKTIVDGLGGKSLTGLIPAMALASAALLGGALLRWREYVEAERLAQGFVHAVRMKVFRHALRLGSEGLKQTSRSVVLLRFAGDLAPLRLWISRGLARGLIGAVTIIATLVALLWMDPLIGLAIAVALAIVMLLTVTLGPSLDRTTRRVRRSRTRMLKHAQQRLSILPVVEAQGNVALERRQMRLRSRGLERTIMAQAEISGAIRAIGEAGAVAASLSAIFVGALLASLGWATVGSIVAAILISSVLGPKVQEITRAFEYWTGARIAAEKLANFLALQPLGRRRGSTSRSKRLEDVTGRLELSNVSYGELVSQMALLAEPGQITWLPTLHRPRRGSVVLELAAGVLQPASGRVTLDGNDLAKVHRDDVRRLIALTSSQLGLVPGRLRDSLTYGVEPERASWLDNVISRYGLGSFFDALPGGLDHVINEHAGDISAGQRLIVGLVRARLTPARVILVDQVDAILSPEETAAVDALLADFEGGVIWASPTEPQIARMAKCPA